MFTLPGDEYVYDDEVIGEGLQGKVHIGRQSSTGEKVAIKFIDKSKLNQRNLDRLATEVKILREVVHEHVVGFKEYIPDYTLPYNSGGNGKGWGVIVMEFCPYDLFDYLLAAGHFSENLARSYFLQLLDGLEECHRRGVFHRDIKPENLLLDTNFRLKIADFGLASMIHRYDSDDGETDRESAGSVRGIQISNRSSNLLRSYCGSNAYMSPEVFGSQPYEGQHADLWSSACVLFVMLSGFQPFAFPGPTDWWLDKVLAGRYSRFWEAHVKSGPHLHAFRTGPGGGDGAQDLFNKMFVGKPHARLSIREIRDHNWMRNGKVLSPAELNWKMADAEAHVQRSKLEERERKAALKVEKQKAEEKAAKAGATGAYKNAFDRNTHRGVGGGADMQAPVYSEAVGALGDSALFYSSLASLEVLMQVDRQLKALDPAARLTVDPVKCSIAIHQLAYPGVILPATEDEPEEQLPAVQLCGTLQVFGCQAPEGVGAAEHCCTLLKFAVPENTENQPASVFTSTKASIPTPSGTCDIFTFMKLVNHVKSVLSAVEEEQLHSVHSPEVCGGELGEGSDEGILEEEIGMV
jgi:serine/threonine protein kinase